MTLQVCRHMNADIFKSFQVASHSMFLSQTKMCVLFGDQQTGYSQPCSGYVADHKMV